MSAATKIEAITVLVKVNGLITLAPIDQDKAEAFVCMLRVFQPGNPEEATLVNLPPSVTKHVLATGKALAEVIAVGKKGGAA